MAIGSGGNYALAAARALLDTELDAEAIVRRAMEIAADICVYTNTIRSSSREPSTSACIADTMTNFFPPRDRLRARPLHRRPERRQARRRHRAAQSLAPPAARRAAARGGAAQEHPDDRADRLRQDRDLAPPRQARQRAVPQGRGDEVHRGRLCRPRRRADRARPRRDRHRARQGRAAARRCRPRRISPPRSACSTRWSAPRPARRRATRFRRKLRANELDDKEIEIEIEGHRGRRRSRFPACRRARWASSHRRHVRQGLRRPHQDAPHDRQGRATSR